MTSTHRPPSPQVPAWFFLVVMALTAVTALSFLQLGKKLAPGSNLPREELKILSRAFDRIDEHYIYQLSEERRDELMHAAVAGMVRKLDRYCRYFPPQKAEDYNRGTRGVMTGIGVVVQNVDGRAMVLYPSPGGPAARAGILVGDIVEAVDGEKVTDTDSAIDLIRGELDTDTTLTVRQGDAPSREVTITRGSVVIPSVKWTQILDAEAGVGYVYLEKFAENSATELDLSLRHLDAELGRRISALVIDLRQNPGGLLDSCLEITNRFIPKGKLLTLKRRGGDDIVHSADPEKCTHPDLPVVLLLDGDSASASEVLAGALQDHERATVVGVRSFGKGVVQSVFSWKDRLERVKITTSYYLTPKGRKLESHLRPEDEKGTGGIKPDREVAIEKSLTRRTIAVRLDRREVPRKYRKDVDALMAAHDQIRILRPLGLDEDPQLAAALDEAREKIRPPLIQEGSDK